MAVFGFGHASYEDLKNQKGEEGVLDNKDFEKELPDFNASERSKEVETRVHAARIRALAGSTRTTWMGKGGGREGRGRGAPGSRTRRRPTLQPRDSRGTEGWAADPTYLSPGQ